MSRSTLATRSLLAQRRHVPSLRPTRFIGAMAFLVAVATPSGAEAQGGLFKRIKETAKERAVSAAARAATATVQKSGQVADTALNVGVVSVDSVTGRASGAASTVVAGFQSRLPGALGGKRSSAGAPATNAAASAATSAATSSTAAPSNSAPSTPATGTAAPDGTPMPLHGAVFLEPADTLHSIAVSYLRQLAPRLRELGPRWTVIATVAPSGDTRRDQARADKRAAAVQAVLVAGGAAASGDLAAVGRVAAPTPETPATGITVVKQR